MLARLAARAGPWARRRWGPVLWREQECRSEGCRRARRPAPRPPVGWETSRPTFRTNAGKHAPATGLRGARRRLVREKGQQRGPAPRQQNVLAAARSHLALDLHQLRAEFL